MEEKGREGNQNGTSSSTFCGPGPGGREAGRAGGETGSAGGSSPTAVAGASPPVALAAPPPPRERNCTFSSTTFSLLRFWPLVLSSQESKRSRPSMNAGLPFWRYFETSSPCLPQAS